MYVLCVRTFAAFLTVYTAEVGGGAILVITWCDKTPCIYQNY